MGVKTTLTCKDLAPYFKATRLIPTLHGTSDSVYIVDDMYILKLFESVTCKEVEAEVKLLKVCDSLPVARIVREPFVVKGKPALLYEKAKGEVLAHASHAHIAQIGAFLRHFHAIARHHHSDTPPRFTQTILHEMIKKSGYTPFMNRFHTLSLELRNDGIIHGDLFIDNATFEADTLSCVFDFSHSCTGDFLFDLAVVALSWCQTQEEKKVLLKSYQSSISLERFEAYIAFAGLYYSGRRYLEQRDFNDLWRKVG
ncbi:phosphotransferase [Sulfurospirillum barnesii]|uniref:Putative homoserine kinase type II (Protein kinase fold) n=1 Tax=Sulfurospirillum barnesii (strain ATCC 700032 / DSM 10660 / SES-3) TaxID=760154 RepID=I3XZN4_SULBS|nr:phosphotransferase [Sulfurospirillum barnesii]AFL69408.1 putative homoserine kinase type II (protein kinase fold) [Sulfurospirillum barnesii SES-3]